MDGANNPTLSATQLASQRLRLCTPPKARQTARFCVVVPDSLYAIWGGPGRFRRCVSPATIRESGVETMESASELQLYCLRARRAD